jgi:hypothetical protein
MTSQPPKSQKHELPSNIGRPATRALTEAGYLRLEQFNGVRTSEILKLHGVGPKAIRLLREALAERGLSFADE